jgi:hypothetical protein
MILHHSSYSSSHETRIDPLFQWRLKRRLCVCFKSSNETMTFNIPGIAIAWTSQSDFGVAPAPFFDGSLFITGSRAGSLSFFRCVSGACNIMNNVIIIFRFDPDSSADSPIHHVHHMTVSSKWITQLAVSSWTLIESGKCEC